MSDGNELVLEKRKKRKRKSKSLDQENESSSNDAIAAANDGVNDENAKPAGIDEKSLKETTDKKTDAGDKPSSDDTEPKLNFHEMGLDSRLLKAITKLKWPKPTVIQEKAIPLALKGKDILSRARTGSGKTGAYAIPIIQMLLNLKENDRMAKSRALVLVPSKELSEQVMGMFNELLLSCSDTIMCSNLAKVDNKERNPILNTTPDVVIGTPGRILAYAKAEQLDVSELMCLVIDEADLVLSFGYEDDIRDLVPFLPNTYQTFVTSATFSDDISSLKNLVLKNPVTLQLRESALPTSERLTQYHVICESEDDKHLLLYALLKLRLLRGKTIIFVNSITRCYRVKLFLEQFSVVF